MLHAHISNSGSNYGNMHPTARPAHNNGGNSSPWAITRTKTDTGMMLTDNHCSSVSQLLHWQQWAHLSALPTNRVIFSFFIFFLFCLFFFSIPLARTDLYFKLSSNRLHQSIKIQTARKHYLYQRHYQYGSKYGK